MFEEKCLAYNQDYAKGKGSYSVNEICQDRKSTRLNSSHRG